MREAAMRRDPADRLWGFGWAGWALLAIAIVLLVVLISGYDLRFAIMSVLTDWFGSQAPIWFVLLVIHPHAVQYSLLSAGFGWLFSSSYFGLAPMAIVWIAMRIHPRRSGWWRYGLVGVLGLTSPVLYGVPLQRFIVLNGLSTQAALTLQWSLAAALVAAVLAVVLPGWRAKLAAVGLVVVGTLPMIDATRFFAGRGLGLYDTWMSTLIEWCWTPAWLVLLLPYAIIARRRLPGPNDCAGCGYSLAGLTGDTCPECGRTSGGLGQDDAPPSHPPTTPTPPAPPHRSPSSHRGRSGTPGRGV
jgi:hypothetical protein